MTEKTKPTNEELLATEDTFLRGIVEAAEDRTSTVVKMEIVRGGKVYFSFDMHALSEEEYLKAQDDATKFKKAKNLGGVKVAEETNQSKFRSLLIYRATTTESKKNTWDNKAAWDALNVLNGPALIDKVLKAGEKKMIIDKLDEISGYGEDGDNEESTSVGEYAKN